jgi:hypothetical protein
MSLQDWRLAPETREMDRDGECGEVRRSWELTVRVVVRLRFCARGEGRWVLLNKRASMRQLLPENRQRQGRGEVG